ncbi:hypothetical protein H7I87_05135 [Mycobacterium timonense]|uniref:Uncharacterized protein n=1 Tax=Mycobacterium bouchedurhonense TaxID=701041 RepID=A0AAW5SCB9_MYCBC|nr:MULTISPECIES: hypothetical protein [Mycobacterium avium complex (MAC)]MCV6993145.1 hypothetical protein [Mycobacterium bouchedurhonense]MCV6994111.1 hypothetical protein [Mycobacterium timonense]MDV3307041.1 hypothetical protein [Mycobacterium avium subsp. hominissuis]
MARFQPRNYRVAAGQLQGLALALQTSTADAQTALQTVVGELNSLAGDRSSPTLQGLAELADRVQTAGPGSVTPEAVENIAHTLLEVADREEQAEAQIRNIWH